MFALLFVSGEVTKVLKKNVKFFTLKKCEIFYFKDMVDFEVGYFFTLIVWNDPIRPFVFFFTDGSSNALYH